MFKIEMFFDAIAIYSRFFRYIFMPIFYMVFWLQFIKSFVDQKPPSNKLLVSNIIIAFVAGLSSECVNLSTSFSLLFLIILQFIFILEKSNWKFKDFVCKIFRTDKNIYLPLISFCFGLWLFYINPCFWQLKNERAISVFSNNFNENILYLSDFLNQWFYFIFSTDYRNFLILGIVVVSFLLLLQRKNFERDIRIILSSLGLIFGVCVFNLTFVFLGKTFPEVCPSANFWFVSDFLRAFSSFVFLAVFFLLLGAYLSTIFEDDAKKEKVVLSVFTVFVVLAVFFSLLNIKGILIKRIQEQSNARKVMYEAEKIYAFYGEQGKSALLPSSIKDCKYIYEEVLGIGSYSNRTASFLSPYYINIYNKEGYVKIILVPDKIALQKFNAAGGTFTKEELSNLKFTMLLDKDFVMGKNKLKG